MNNFIPITEQGSDAIFFIKPFDIINIISYASGVVDVTYAVGDRVCRVTTLITAQEIIEAIEKSQSYFILDLDQDGE